MKQKVPIRRLLSGFLATAMALSLVPPQLANANGSSTVFNSGSQLAGTMPGSYHGTDGWQGPGEARYGLKIGLQWAPATEAWTIDNPQYDWNSSVTLLEGVFLRMDALTETNLPAVGTWYKGNAVGTHTGKQTWDVYKGSSLFDSFNYLFPVIHEQGREALQVESIDRSSAAWYGLTEMWGIESSWAQTFKQEEGHYPTVAVMLEEWRSAIFDMERKYVNPTDGTLTYEAPYTSYNEGTYTFGTVDHSKVPSNTTALTVTEPRLGLPLNSDMFGTGWTTPGDDAAAAGWRISSHEYSTSFFSHPYFINWLDFIIPVFGTGSIDTNSGFDLTQTGYRDSHWFDTASMLTGTIVKNTGVTETGGSYKLSVEPVQYRDANKVFSVLGYKDAVAQYKYDIEVGTGYYSNRMSSYNPLLGGFNYWGNMAMGYKLGEADSYLNVSSIYNFNKDNAEHYGVYGNLHETYVENPFGFMLITFPTVPTEDVDPLPTIIKTYVEIDYDEAGNIQYNSDGTIKYKWAAPSTLAATLSTTNVATWNKSDTTYVVTDGVVTQQPNIHLWEAVDVYDANREPVIDPETGDLLTQRAYLNDVITTSINVKSDPETTEWTGLNPTGFTYNGDVMEELWREPEVITSYSYDLLVKGDQFKGMETKEQFLGGLSIVDNYYSGNYSSEKSALPISAVRDAARYSDKASASTLLAEATSGELAGIKGANFLNESGLSDHLKGYYKADEVYQATATVNVDGMAGENRYIPNTTLNYLMGFNEDGTEQIREDVRNEALTNVSNGEKPYTKGGFLDENAPNPIDKILDEPGMYGSYEYGSNVTVLRYIVGEPPEIPNQKHIIKLVYVDEEGEPTGQVAYYPEDERPLKYTSTEDSACDVTLYEETIVEIPNTY